MKLAKLNRKFIKRNRGQHLQEKTISSLTKISQRLNRVSNSTITFIINTATVAKHIIPDITKATND